MVLFWACGKSYKIWDIVNSTALQDASLKFKIQTNDVYNCVKFQPMRPSMVLSLLVLEEMLIS